LVRKRIQSNSRGATHLRVLSPDSTSSRNDRHHDYADAVPVYFFTFHGYRTWMPDHPRGYTRRGEGYLKPDEEMAEFYEEESASEEESIFDAPLAKALIEELQIACRHQGVHLHAAGTELSHIHALVSWRSEKTWLQVRNALKISLSLRLKREGNQALNTSRNDTIIKLSRGGSRKRVENRAHFDYLMQTYIPKHKGPKWFEDRGWVDVDTS
jgi:REP element-mobilizing transposase RayT